MFNWKNINFYNSLLTLSLTVMQFACGKLHYCREKIRVTKRFFSNKLLNCNYFIFERAYHIMIMLLYKANLWTKITFQPLCKIMILDIFVLKMFSCLLQKLVRTEKMADFKGCGTEKSDNLPSKQTGAVREYFTK